MLGAVSRMKIDDDIDDDDQSIKHPSSSRQLLKAHFLRQGFNILQRRRTYV